TPEQAEEAQKDPIILNPPPPRVHKAFYFVEYVRQYLEEQYGPNALYRGGFAVETTLDMRLQQLAEQTLKQDLMAIDKRYGIYKRTMSHLDLTGDSATDTALVAAVTKPEEGETTVREGDRLTGVVLTVRDTATTVAIKNTRGMIPRAGHAWVRQIDPALSADV